MLADTSSHEQWVTAMFGALIFEEDQLSENGHVCNHSHDWAKMFEGDIRSLDCIDEGAVLCDYIYSRRGIWTLVCEGEVLDMFLKIDMSQLRAKHFSVCIPSPGLEPITPSVANPPVPVVEETHANYPFR